MGKIKIGIFLLMGMLNFLFAVEIAIDQNSSDSSEMSKMSKAYFGEQIFKGNFKENQQYRYNPDYVINIGDVISTKIWGAYEYEADLTVDKQGNIFLPKVGEIHLLGLSNSKLKSKITEATNKTFNDNVYVYANIQQYQPISIFVSGSVKNVGLYTGLSTDSILQFIDKAGGILRGQGSYRHIEILRNKKVIKHIDLYQFVLNGQIDMFQFQNGDVILVNPVVNYVEVEGDINRPYIFELLDTYATVQDIIPYTILKPTVNSFMLTKWNDRQEITTEYGLENANNVTLEKGMKLKFFSNYYVNNVTVSLEGEHRGIKNISVKKGTTLYDVLEKVNFTPLSDIDNIRIYRKSVASVQKQLIETMLKDLEARAFTSDSSTVEEANIRNKESEMIMKFIERTRKVEPLGQIVISKKDDLSKIYLENGDKVVIPKYSNIVIIQGEVNIPNALAYKENYSIDDYVNLCGGYGERADTDKVLLIKANGEVFKYSSESFFGNKQDLRVDGGDSILVLGKVDSKNILITSSVTQILYQVAVGAAVVLRVF